MGNPDAIQGCEPDPAHFGLRLPKLATAGSTLTLLVAMLFLFCNVNMAQGATFVLQDGKRIEGEIVYASASSVIIRKTNGATAQLGRHTIDRVTLATDNDAVLEGELEGWKKGVYEISTDSGVFKVQTRRIISQRQISSQEIVVATVEEKERAIANFLKPDIVAATAEEKEPDIVVATTEEKEHDIVIATVEEKEDAKKLVFKLELSGPVKQKVLLIYSTEDGTALAGSDYEAKRGSMVLQPGTTNATVSVTLLDDDLAEGDETFGLLVTSDLDLATVKVKRGSATILDNEPQAANQ
jgi:hypothetical protein